MLVRNDEHGHAPRPLGSTARGWRPSSPFAPESIPELRSARLQRYSPLSAARRNWNLWEVFPGFAKDGKLNNADVQWTVLARCVHKARVFVSLEPEPGRPSRHLASLETIIQRFGANESRAMSSPLKALCERVISISISI